MKKNKPYLILGACLFLSLSCTTPEPDTPAPTPQRAVQTRGSAKTGPSQIVKIVFVGQKEACDCTKKRVADSWAALQGALEKQKDVAVERIQRDVDTEQARKLAEIRPMMVAPGLYFFDVNEHLVEMLQGEVTTAQIEQVL